MAGNGQKNMKSNFTVEGMRCGSCANRVEKAVRELPGISSVSIGLTPGSAEIEFNAQETTAEEIRKKITAAGYAARLTN